MGQEGVLLGSYFRYPLFQTLQANPGYGVLPSVIRTVYGSKKDAVGVLPSVIRTFSVSKRGAFGALPSASAVWWFWWFRC